MFTVATDAAPGRPNEDFVIVTPNIAIVVDGAGVPTSGCHHGVAWYAQQLGTMTMAALIEEPKLDLAAGLAEGINRVANLHSGTCQLTTGKTPCAAIGIARVGPDVVETLSLSDVAVVVDTHDGPQVTCDLGIELTCGTEPDALAGLLFDTDEHRAALTQLVDCQTQTRNKPDGWWVADIDPTAAMHAVTDSYPRTSVKRIAVLSDGSTRPVDQMKVWRWSTLLELLETLGPTEVIAQVRAIEVNDPNGEIYPRTKRHDDAAIAFGVC